MNFLPLWTASVCPTNSGRMVDRRDHVRTTFFSFLSFMSATFLARWSSVNGPFFSDLLILLLHLPAHDPLISTFVVTRLETACRLAPGRHGMTSAGGLTFAAAVRMIHRVHRNAAIVRALAQPTRLPGFAMRLVFVLDIANLADGRHAVGLDAANFARRQLEQGDFALTRDELCLRAGGSRHLSAFSGPQLDVVNHGAGRDIFQRQRIADQDVSFGTRAHGAPDL